MKYTYAEFREKYLKPFEKVSNLNNESMIADVTMNSEPLIDYDVWTESKCFTNDPDYAHAGCDYALHHIYSYPEDYTMRERVVVHRYENDVNDDDFNLSCEIFFADDVMIDEDGTVIGTLTKHERLDKSDRDRVTRIPNHKFEMASKVFNSIINKTYRSRLYYRDRVKWFFTNYFETGMELGALIHSMQGQDLDNFKWYDEYIKIPNFKDEL